MRALAASLLVCSFCLPPRAAAASKAMREKAERDLETALDQHRKGAHAAALGDLTRAISADPSLREAYALRAMTRHALGDREGMLKDLTEGLRLPAARNPRVRVLRGNSYLLAGQWEKALDDFNAAIDIDDENADAYLGRGRVLRARGRHEEAVKEWSRALSLDPDLLTARYNAACALYELGKPDEAISQVTKALRSNPRFHLPFHLLGVIFAERGDTARAIKAYSKAIRLAPDFSAPYLGRALVYHKLGKPQLAQKDFDESVRLAGGDYAPYYNRGEFFLRTGKKEAALEDLKAALARGVTHPPAAEAIGRRLQGAGLQTEAAAAFTQALAAAEGHPDPAMREPREGLLLARAESYEALKRLGEAQKDLDLAVKISSQSAPAWTARGQLYDKRGQSDRAFADLSRALEYAPAHAPALLARGNVHAKLKRYREALKDFGAALEADATLADAYNNRGVIEATIVGEFDQAVEDLELAVALKPESAGFHLNLGVARLRRGDYWKSVAALDKALALKAPAVRVLEQRAEAYYSLGDVEKASEDIQEAIKLEPKSSALYAALGSFSLRSRLYPKAIKELDYAIRLDSRNDLAYLYRGLAYGGIGDYARASRSFGAAARKGERPVVALTYLCQSERLRGRHRGAVGECNEALKLDPEHGEAFLQRGLAFLALRDYAKAVRDLDDGIRLSPPRPQAYLARSLAHIPLKQFRESDEAFRRAQALDPQVRSAELTLGEEPSAAWEYQTRVDAWAKLLEASADDPHAYLVRGNALHSGGYYDRAILEYTRAMEMDAQLAAAYLGRAAALAAQESLDAAEVDHRRAADLVPDDPLAQLGLVTLLTTRRKYSQGFKSVLAALRRQADNPLPELFVKAGNIRYFLKDVDKAEENFRLALKFDPNHSAAFNGIGLCQFSRRDYPSALENFSRAIALNREYDRFYRNRASTFVNMRKYRSALEDYKLALAANRIPEMVSEYQKLIAASQKMLPQAPAAESSAKKLAGNGK